jgi:hypothetical protein
VGDRSRGRYARRPPNSLHTMVHRTGGFTYGVWGLGFVHHSRTFLCRAVPHLRSQLLHRFLPLGNRPPGSLLPSSPRRRPPLTVAERNTQMVMLLAFRPTTLGMLSALAMLWVYVLQVRRDEMNVLGVRLGVRYQAVLLLLLTVVLVFLCTNAAAMLSSVASVGMACAGVHAGTRVNSRTHVNPEAYRLNFSRYQSGVDLKRLLLKPSLKLWSQRCARPSRTFRRRPKATVPSTKASLASWSPTSPTRRCPR